MSMKNQTACPTRRLAAGICAIALLLACGCNIISPIIYALEGPPKNPAVADLEKGRSTVVFVDDRNSRLPKRALRTEIAQVAEQTLLKRGLIAEGNMIAGASALRAAAGESDDEPMTIVDIGRAVGAEVIVYAEVVAFTLTRDGVSMAPAARLQVKIFDTVANERTWPEGEAGYPLVIRMPETQGQVFGMSLAERSAAERGLAQTVGLRLAQLFYTTERTSALGS